MEEINWAYIAGVFDSIVRIDAVKKMKRGKEGYFLYVQLIFPAKGTLCAKQVFQLLDENHNVNRERYSNIRNITNHDKISFVLINILPYLKVKKKVAEYLLEHDSLESFNFEEFDKLKEEFISPAQRENAKTNLVPFREKIKSDKIDITNEPITPIN